MPLFKKVVNGRPVGQLLDVHLKVLRRCRMILIKDLDPSDVLNGLSSEDGFRPDVRDSILALWPHEEQAGAILDRLETQSDATFGTFMDFLREHYKHLHSVLEETRRTLDENDDDDRTRERAAIVGDSVRKLLRQTMRRRAQDDRTRRESSESPAEYYVDNLRNDNDDSGHYLDCYTISTRGRLQREKWIKHAMTTTEDVDSERAALASKTISEMVVTRDVVFRRIDRSFVPDDVEEQPPKSCGCIFVVKTVEKEKEGEPAAAAPIVDLPAGPPSKNAEKRKDSDTNGTRNEEKALNRPPPPLPPKPEILTLSGRGSVSSIVPLPKRNAKGPEVPNRATEKPAIESPNVSKASQTPPLPVRKPHKKSAQPNLSPTPSETGAAAVELPVVARSRDEGRENGDKEEEEEEAEEDSLSLNFNIAIDDEDEEEEDPYEPITPDDRSKRRPSVTSRQRRSRKGSSRRTSSNQSMTPTMSSCRETTPSCGDTPGIKTVPDSQSLREDVNFDVFGLDRHVLIIDATKNSAESSYYEEIEVHRDRGSRSPISALYLDPCSDAHPRNRTLRIAPVQLKDLNSPDEVVLTSGTLLIMKRKEEIANEHPDFKNTLLAYDHMGFAYYVPADAVRRYGDPENELWFYPIEMAAREATLFLGSVCQQGCFVVYRPLRRSRPSHVYCLSVCLTSGDVVHYNVVENFHGDVMIQDHDHSFMNVCDLVEYFRKNQSGLATRLRRSLKEANLPIMPGYHYHPRYEIQRKEISVSSMVIGKGTFGEYRLAAFKGISVVVSVMTKNASSSNDDDFLEEAFVMMRTRHENVVRILGVSCSVRPFYIVTEHVERGTLRECLQNNTIPSDNIDSLFDICIQIVHALHYLESLAYLIHRDLASKSFFVTTDFLVKLGKFERARHVVDDNYQAPPSEEVMVRWAAPEVLAGSTYSTKSDVWSLGIVFWEVFSRGTRPYASLDVEQVAIYVTEGGRLDKPPGCASDLWSMMKSCWKHSSNDRPTFAMLHDKIKGKSSIYYVSPVRNHVTAANKTAPAASDATKHNGGVVVQSKTKSLNPVKLMSYKKTPEVAGENAKKKRSASASRLLQEPTTSRDDGENNRPNSGVKNRRDRARTPSSDSSSVLSAYVLNNSSEDLNRGQRIRKSIKKFLK